MEFRLWDVLAAREMLALAFTTVPNNWRRIGHIISDKIYERLTGEKGYFDTRIIYVSEEGPKTKRVKKLAIMDQDGFNTKYLTLGNELVLTPRFNPTNQMVTYLILFQKSSKSLFIRYRNRHSRSSWRFSRNDFCTEVFTRWKKNNYEFC